MKTTLITLLAGISLLSFTAVSSAQFQGTGADGITASPKLRQFINEGRPAASNVSVPAMVCSKCQDEVVTRVDSTARGATKPTVTATRHLCPGCNTKLTNTGMGKATKSVATHTCTEAVSGKPSCCAARS